MKFKDCAGVKSRPVKFVSRSLIQFGSWTQKKGLCICFEIFAVCLFSRPCGVMTQMEILSWHPMNWILYAAAAQTQFHTYSNTTTLSLPQGYLTSLVSIIGPIRISGHGTVTESRSLVAEIHVCLFAAPVVPLKTSRTDEGGVGMLPIVPLFKCLGQAT